MCARLLRVFLAVVICALTVFAAPTYAQQATIADRLAQAITYYTDLEFDKGIAVAQDILATPGLEARDSIGVYAVMSMLTYGKGEQFSKKSYAYLEQIATIGPCTLHLPYDFWPQQLRDRWYSIVKARNSLVCPEESDGKVKTIAIMEFDNYSMGKYQEELGFITKGLADFFEADFARISQLRVVERDKIEYILRELELTKSGKTEAATAIRIGKLLGAQVMVFGSITQLDDKTARMLVKAVRVETSEIIASVERDGRPDYFKMQKELVKELAAQLDITLNTETVQQLDNGGTQSYDAATLYSKGLYFMDKYDYKQAYEFFKMAYEKDNTFDEAKQKMDIYRPLAAG